MDLTCMSSIISSYQIVKQAIYLTLPPALVCIQSQADLLADVDLISILQADRLVCKGGVRGSQTSYDSRGLDGKKRSIFKLSFGTTSQPEE